ncbi:hypothetical protein BJF87_22285 [Gordonia sp. CNJ-863]|uniref:hypothetical protein n=1 Tax=Gordonia sp. CNJ-863 TaxID=1904963 RepID=UPI0009602EEE|nr:hypothetical protein [Gordonia sp. CNJ-863]OLT46652.1 hypothetical protein BJF87_22285 [Gordonia sp. CNJ-863]
MTDQTTAVSPTVRWRAAVPELPALTEPAAITAERLLLLVHYNLDWDSWIGEHRRRYWDELLPSRVRTATYRADTLPAWWSLLAQALPIVVTDKARRLEVAQLLAEPSAPVLAILREQLPALVLRVRIIAETVAEHRRTTTAADAAEEGS